MPRRKHCTSFRNQFVRHRKQLTRFRVVISRFLPAMVTILALRLRKLAYPMLFLLPLEITPGHPK